MGQQGADREQENRPPPAVYAHATRAIMGQNTFSRASSLSQMLQRPCLAWWLPFSHKMQPIAVARPRATLRSVAVVWGPNSA